MSQATCPFKDDFPFARGADALVPPAEYAYFRQEEPIRQVRLWNDQRAWLFTRWADVREVLANNAFSADPEQPGYPTTSPARGAELHSRKTFINMDPPDHTRLRRMLTREFMVKRVSQMKPLIETLMAELFDALERRGPGTDIIEVVTKPLPANVISAMLGVPREDFARLGHLSEIRNSHSAAPEEIRAAATEMVEHLTRIITEKMPVAETEEDLLCRLIVAQINTGELEVIEAARLSALLYLAGHETTTNQMGLGLLSFFRFPEQMEKLKQDPTLLAQAVEEMLRHSTITHLNSARVAKEDVVVSGQLIRKGEAVYPNVAAANYDPAVFENPESFDITRAENPHMAFAYGIHQCLGQPLARLELSVFFGEVFRRFPNLSCAIPDEDIRFITSAQTLSVISLPVNW